MRTQLLSLWFAKQPKLVISEYDVNATITVWCIQSETHPIPAAPSDPFRDQDFVWMPWDTILEPGIYRQALLSPYATPTSRWNQCSSPFTDTTDLGSPLNYEVYDMMLSEHPYRAWFLNGLRFGFSLMCNPPIGPQPSKVATFKPGQSQEYRDKLMTAVMKEKDMRAFVVWPPPDADPVLDWLQHTPLFGVLKPDGSLRMISHLSYGPSAINRHTNRSGHFKARLAKITNVFQFVNHMRRDKPDRTLLAVKYDAVKAFRQVPIMARQACLTAHLVGKVTYVNVRCPMGAQASGDAMGPAISIIRDYVARQWGVFSESYSDDHLFVLTKKQTRTDLPRVKKLWLDAGWKMQTDKLIEHGEPTAVIPFLGVEIDLQNRTVAVTESRRVKMIAYLKQWLNKEVPWDDREFARIGGRLRFVAKMVPFGRAFTTSFARFTNKAAKPEVINDDATTLPLDVKFDIHWWLYCFQLPDMSIALPKVTFAPCALTQGADIWTDAASWGMAGVNHTTRQYFVHKWAEGEEAVGIPLREGAAIVVAAVMWPSLPVSQYTLVNTDSESCSKSFGDLSCHDLRLRIMLRMLSLVQTHSKTPIRFKHVRTEENVHADALSRGSSTPLTTEYTQISIPDSTLKLLTDLLLTWLSDQNTGLQQTSQLFERSKNIVMQSVTVHPTQTTQPLQWTHSSIVDTLPFSQ